MWISGQFTWKHSLSTCGQTVCKYQEVIHIFVKKMRSYFFKPSTVHVILSLAVATGHQIEGVWKFFHEHG